MVSWKITMQIVMVNFYMGSRSIDSKYTADHTRSFHPFSIIIHYCLWMMLDNPRMKWIIACTKQHTKAASGVSLQLHYCKKQLFLVEKCLFVQFDSKGVRVKVSCLCAKSNWSWRWFSMEDHPLNGYECHLKIRMSLKSAFDQFYLFSAIK